MNEVALGYLGFGQTDLRSNGPTSWGYATFLLQKDGNLPMFVPPDTKIVPDRQNTNILLSSVHAVSEVWKEVRI